MKTTIDISAPLLEQAKRLAADEGRTLKAVVEDALRAHLELQSRPRKAFKLRFRGVKGEGLQPGIREGDWETFRGLTYEGRGG